MYLTSDKAPTLYDLLEYYGYTSGDIFGEFPIWNPNKRDWLIERITNHFYYREINQDTPAQFCFFMKRRMIEIMPTFNPIFKALEDARADVGSWQDARILTSTTPQTQLSGAEQYADGLQDTRIESGSNVASNLMEWYAGVNNALLLLYNELEPLFYQFWEEV